MTPNIPVPMTAASGTTALVVVAIVLGVTAILVRQAVNQVQQGNSNAARSPWGY